MTTARPKRKQYPAWLTAGAGLVFALAAAPLAARATVTDQIVVDSHTGLAIDGYDPVAFFTDGQPVRGSADFELNYGGVIWRFCNSGNRDEFGARPDVYMPQFGGYDPLGVARGVAVAGNPNVWFISGERLFLFYNQERLETFAAAPHRVIGAAERKWPDVMSTLTP
jgi:YHS domain-containing protein